MFIVQINTWNVPMVPHLVELQIFDNTHLFTRLFDLYEVENFAIVEQNMYIY